MSTSANLIQYARSYRAHGFSILRTDGKKVPVGSWKAYQSTPIADKDIDSYLDQPQVAGLGVICGSVSGHLEVIDVDTKHALDPDGLFGELTQAIMEIDADLFPRLVVARTPSGGYHIYYRCVEPVCGNKKLASRLAEGDELREMQEAADSEADAQGRKHHKVDPVICFIETRGEGGYVAAMPTPGYEFIQNKVSEVPVVTASERETLWAAVLSLSLYTPPIEEYKPRSSDAHKEGLTPLDDYNERGDVVGLLQTHGWKFIRQQGEKSIMLRPGTTDSKSSGDYHAGKRLFSVFTTSTAFEPVKGYSPAAVYAKLEHDGDFSKAAKALYAEGYGERRNGKSVNGAAKLHIGANGSLHEEPQDLLTFWHVEYDEKKDKHTTTIVRHKFLTFLHEQGGFGLYRYDPTKTGYAIIQVADGIVTEVSSEHVRKFTLSYIASLPDWFDDIHRDTLLEVFLKNEGVLKPAHLEFLPRVFPDFLRDTPEEAFYPFANGIVCITSEGVKLRQLAELGKCIWSTQIKGRDITLLGDEQDPASIEFFQFISKISNDDHDRIMYCMSIIGYLLHGYKKASNSFCVIMCEETETKGGIGGTGKGILWKGLGHLVPRVFLSGKSKNLMDSNFLFDEVQPDTKLLIIDDTRKNFDFESVFTIITEGIHVEQKYKGKVFIPFEEAPKLIFTTNYVIDSATTAARRRQRTLEFTRFFHHGYTPKQHFGHEFFVDWTGDEWTKFYNLLFACVQQYLTSGVPVRDNSIALQRRSLMEKYGDSILEFWDEWLAVSGDWKLTSELYAEYLDKEGIDGKFYSAKKFRAALEACAALSKVRIVERKNCTLGGKRQIITEPIENEDTKDNNAPVPF